MARKSQPPIRSDADALLAAVWASPHSDTPRLVYADYLEESGDADRAEFIRLQVVRAAAEAAGNDVSDEAHRREEELLPLPRRDWPTFDAGPFVHFEMDHYFLRGFAAPVVEATAGSAWGLRAPAGAARVWASWDRPGGAAVLRSEVIRGAEELRLTTPHGGWGAADLAELAGPGRPDSLRRLWIDGSLGAPDWVAGLDLAGLRALRLPLGPTGVVAALARSPVAARLAELDLTSVAYWPGDLRDAQESAAFPRLRVLRLHSNLGPAGDQVSLAASGLLRGLRELDVAERFTHPAGSCDPLVRALAAAPPPDLRVLRLPLCHPVVSDQARREFCESPRLGRLRELHARPVQDSGALWPGAARLKAAFGERLRPAHLWADVPAGGTK